MTVGIARIVGGMLSSTRMFSVGEDEVWLPFAEDTFEVCEHLARALTLHGHSAFPTRARAYSGISVEVEGAESVSHQALKGILGETYGYKGRIPSIQSEKLPYDATPFEPGNILEIPHLGWTGDECRIVTGSDSGICLAQIHTDNVEMIPLSSKLKITNGVDAGNTATLRELLREGRIIVKKREWTSYPQQTY